MMPDFWTVWMMLFGNSLVAGVAIVGIMAFLCMAVGMSFSSSLIVMLPTMWGIADSSYFPTWFKAMIIIPVGALWGLALLRMMRGA